MTGQQNRNNEDWITYKPSSSRKPALKRPFDSEFSNEKDDK